MVCGWTECVILVPVHFSESKTAVGARMSNLIADLRADKGGGRRAPRVKPGALHLADIAMNQVPF